MSPVAKNFATHLNAVSWKALKFHVAFNVDAEIRKEGANLPELLTQQIANPVQWTKCTETLQQLNPNAYVEMGPNKVLTGLVKRILDKPKIFSMDTLEDLRLFQAALKENAV
jgi:[acyl-carrier-protein] S-malonyltransferase